MTTPTELPLVARGWVFSCLPDGGQWRVTAEKGPVEVSGVASLISEAFHKAEEAAQIEEAHSFAP